MSQTLDFYFEFSSPYGYFASTGIEALGAEIGCTVTWHPILLGPMFKAMGSAPLVEIPMKGDYARLDFARTARLFNLPYRHPDPFPIATVGAARAALYVRENHPDQVAAFVKRVYHAYFALGRPISDTQVVLDIASEMGLDAAQIANGIAGDAIKGLLKTEVEQAMAKGVFGSPFMIIGNEPFWGFDRFDHIRRWIKQEGATGTPT